jgi:hypothetical protein
LCILAPANESRDLPRAFRSLPSQLTEIALFHHGIELLFDSFEGRR